MTEEIDFKRAMQNLNQALEQAVDVQSETAEVMHETILKYNGSLTTGIAAGVLISLAYAIRQVALRLGDDAPAELAATATIAILQQLEKNLEGYTAHDVLTDMMAEGTVNPLSTLEPQGHA